MAVGNNLHLPICTMLGVSKKITGKWRVPELGKHEEVLFKRYRTAPCNIKILLGV
jgi:hypothetical protein